MGFTHHRFFGRSPENIEHPQKLTLIGDETTYLEPSKREFNIKEMGLQRSPVPSHMWWKGYFAIEILAGNVTNPRWFFGTKGEG